MTSNQDFPAEFGALQTALVDNHVTFSGGCVPLDLRNSGLAQLLARNPVAAARVYRRILNVVFTVFLGLPLDARKTVAMSLRPRGIGGRMAFVLAMTECQHRDCGLHAHSGGFPHDMSPQVVQKAAALGGVVEEAAMGVLDSYLVAKISTTRALEHLVRDMAVPDVQAPAGPSLATYECGAVPPPCPLTCPTCYPPVGAPVATPDSPNGNNHGGDGDGGVDDGGNNDDDDVDDRGDAPAGPLPPRDDAHEMAVSSPGPLPPRDDAHEMAVSSPGPLPPRNDAQEMALSSPGPPVSPFFLASPAASSELTAPSPPDASMGSSPAPSSSGWPTSGQRQPTPWGQSWRHRPKVIQTPPVDAASSFPSPDASMRSSSPAPMSSGSGLSSPDPAHVQVIPPPPEHSSPNAPMGSSPDLVRSPHALMGSPMGSPMLARPGAGLLPSDSSSLPSDSPVVGTDVVMCRRLQWHLEWTVRMRHTVCKSVFHRHTTSCFQVSERQRRRQKKKAQKASAGGAGKVAPAKPARAPDLKCRFAMGRPCTVRAGVTRLGPAAPFQAGSVNPGYTIVPRTDPLPVIPNYNVLTTLPGMHTPERGACLVFEPDRPLNFGRLDADHLDAELRAEFANAQVPDAPPALHSFRDLVTHLVTHDSMVPAFVTLVAESLRVAAEGDAAAGNYQRVVDLVAVTGHAVRPEDVWVMQLAYMAEFHATVFEHICRLGGIWNCTVAPTSGVASAVLACNVSLEWLATEAQSRGSFEYLLKYMVKGKGERRGVALMVADAIIKSHTYKSVAPDAGTPVRSGTCICIYIYL
jgi:hypothetical protein